MRSHPNTIESYIKIVKDMFEIHQLKTVNIFKSINKIIPLFKYLNQLYKFSHAAIRGQGYYHRASRTGRSNLFTLYIGLGTSSKLNSERKITRKG